MIYFFTDEFSLKACSLEPYLTVPVNSVTAESLRTKVFDVKRGFIPEDLIVNNAQNQIKVLLNDKQT